MDHQKTSKTHSGHKTYEGERSGQVWVTTAGRRRPLRLRLDLRNHSPTGFAWGYGGSGPAQLALALLADLLDDERALDLYQTFKWRVIGRLPYMEPWTLTEDHILSEVAAIEMCDERGSDRAPLDA